MSTSQGSMSVCVSHHDRDLGLDGLVRNASSTVCYPLENLEMRGKAWLENWLHAIYWGTEEESARFQSAEHARNEVRAALVSMAPAGPR